MGKVTSEDGFQLWIVMKNQKKIKKLGHELNLQYVGRL